MLDVVDDEQARLGCEVVGDLLVERASEAVSRVDGETDPVADGMDQAICVIGTEG